MDPNRIINIILTDLSLDNLKLQEKLEFEINTIGEVDKKSETIKNILKDIAINELAITKFQSIVSQSNNNNNLNQNENGKI